MGSIKGFMGGTFKGSFQGSISLGSTWSFRCTEYGVFSGDCR